MKVKREAGKGDKALKKLLKDDGFSKSASIGWFPKNRYVNGQPVANVAAINEFGPYARPFMRPAIEKNKAKWARVSKTITKQVLKGDITETQALEQLALVVQGDFQKSIKEVLLPPLAESTIEARLAKRKNKADTISLRKPLVDTGIMLNTLTKVVK